MKHWTTDTSGRVLWDTGGGMVAHEIDGPTDRTRAVESWASIAARKARRYDVPISWILGTIWAESGGDPDAISSAGAVGLMQVIPRWHQTNRAAMLDPERNIDKGAQIQGGLRRAGFDLPEVASAYNAGLDRHTGRPYVSSANHWGMREQPGYISGVCKANNYFVGRLQRGEIDLGGGRQLLAGLALLVAAGGVLWVSR